MTSLFIARHGNTFAAGEPPRRIGARTDLALTGEGRQQAIALGRWFADQGIAFGTALHGPLRRTIETADLVLAAQPAAVASTPAAWLAEIDHGIDEDQPEALVRDRIGEAALRRWNEAGIVPPGWQVDRDDRIARWRALLADPPPGNVLIVTSSGAARFALLALAGAGLPPSLGLRTGAIGHLCCAGRGEPARLVDWDVRPASASDPDEPDRGTVKTAPDRLRP